LYPHASTTSPETQLFKFDRNKNPLRDDLLVDSLDPTDGSLAVPDGPGLGVEVDESALERLRAD
jgi:D-galactarolactone cycloisomerase